MTQRKRIILTCRYGKITAYSEADPIRRTNERTAAEAIGMLVMREAEHFGLEIYEPADHDDHCAHIAAVNEVLRTLSPHDGHPRPYKPRDGAYTDHRFYLHRVDWNRGSGFIVHGVESGIEVGFPLESFLRDWETT
jgi:hypothetical protein